MDVDGLPIIGPGVDFTQVRAIHQKRTLAFINHFILNTVSFLNKFSRSCELRFERFEAKIQKLEASLSILEAKLVSISGLEQVTPVTFNQSDVPVSPAKAVVVEETLEIDREVLADKAVEVKQENSYNAAQDPLYSRFFKMIQVGVPIQAVRLKMSAEGLDSSVLDKPNEPIATSTTQPRESRNVSESESTASSFSEE